MQNIGGKHQVITVRFITLLFRLVLDIQGAILNRTFSVSEAIFCLRKKACRYISVDIFEPAFRKLRQYERRGRPCTGSDLYNSKFSGPLAVLL